MKYLVDGNPVSRNRFYEILELELVEHSKEDFETRAKSVFGSTALDNLKRSKYNDLYLQHIDMLLEDRTFDFECGDTRKIGNKEFKTI